MPAAKLHAAGLRVTAAGGGLAALPTGAHRALAEIVAVARRRIGRLSAQAVHDVLEVLAKAQSAGRIEPAGPRPV